MILFKNIFINIIFISFMEPELIDYDTFFKKKVQVEKIDIKTKSKVNIQQIDNTKIIINFVGILLLILGLYLLFQRQNHFL